MSDPKKGRCKWLDYDNNICEINVDVQCIGAENCEDYEEGE